MRRPALRDIVERLVQEGLAEDELRPRLSAAIEGSTDAGTPWFLQLLLGLGTWIAAILLVVSLNMGAILNADTSLPIGLVLCAGALLLRGSRSQAARIDDFLEQLYLAVSLAGQAVAVYGAFTGYEPDTAALAIFVLETGLVLVYPSAFGRFLSVNFAWIALMVFLATRAALPVDLAVTLAGLTLVATGCVQAAASAPRLAPVVHGSATFLLGLLLVSWPGWPATAALTIAVGLVALRIQGKVSPLLLAIVLFGVITASTPGLVGAAVVMMIGFYRRDGMLLGLALAFLLVFAGAYYYRLEMTLLLKSGVLAASGGMLLLVRSRLAPPSVPPRGGKPARGGLMSQRSLLLLGIAVVVLGTHGLILHKELLLRNGRPVYLELAPADPRSLMLGDFMLLDYAIDEALPYRTMPPRGHLVLGADSRGVAHFVRMHQGEALRDGEFLLGYRIQCWRAVIGADSYFFQEGHARRYARARYAELRITPSGDSVLAGLLDDRLQPIVP